MARGESQTLLIWTIIFIVLLLISIVVNVVFYNKYTGTVSQIADAAKKNQELQTQVSGLQAEGTDLRALIGYSDPKNPVADIKTAFEGEVTVAAAGVPKATVSYKDAFTQLTASYKAKGEENKAQATQIIAQQELIDKQNAKEEKLKTDLMAQVDAANKNLTDAQEKFTQLEGEMKKQVTDLNEQLTKTKNDTTTAIAEANKRQAEAENKRDKVLGINEGLTTLVRQFDSPTVTYNDAKVIWVSADNKMAKINKGFKDGITPRISFSVYPPDVQDVPVSSNKGKIEVTKVLDDNTAEVRITEDVWLEPIMTGDVIYTPIWKPGQKTHFALSSGLDIDGNGSSDFLFVKQVIEMNGGIVDAYIDDQSGDYISEGRKDEKRVREVKVEGKITPETDYYIIANKVDPKKRLDVEVSESLSKAKTQMDDDAKLNSVKSLTLQELFNLMGFRLQSEKIGFGKANRDGNEINMVPDVVKSKTSGNVFRNFEEPDAKPATGTTLPVSPLFNQRKIGVSAEGSASPLFQKRKPFVEDDSNKN